MLWVCVQVLSVCVREWGAVTCRTPLFIRVDRSRLEAALFVFFFSDPDFRPALHSLLLWGKRIAYKAVWKLQVADLREKGMGSVLCVVKTSKDGCQAHVAVSVCDGRGIVFMLLGGIGWMSV